MSSFVISATVGLALVAATACTRGGPSERGEARSEPAAKTATLQLGAKIAEPAKAESSTVSAAQKAASDACPSGMVLVEGEYCPEVEHKCLEWMDPPSSRYAHFRCKRYEKSAVCKGAKVHRRYCIDATERTESDSKLPRHFMSWTSSKALCESEGARLCRESEWIFACEGEEMRPYPYGWERDTTACNTDITEGIGKVGRLNDLRSEVGSHAKCASPFGVQDLAGNVEEWTQADGPGQGSKMGWKEVLKGSWWIPSRHACRQFQVGHNDVYNGGETGTRCCKDAPPREVASR
jgi:hypothetical protein